MRTLLALDNYEIVRYQGFQNGDIVTSYYISLEYTITPSVRVRFILKLSVRDSSRRAATRERERERSAAESIYVNAINRDKVEHAGQYFII